MNESRNPIDELFRKGLEGYSVEPSADLFENIMQKRSRMHRIMLKLKTNGGKLTLLTGLMVFLTLGVWAVFQQSETEAKQLSQLKEEHLPESISPAVKSGVTTTPEPVRIQSEANTESTLNPVLMAQNDFHQTKTETPVHKGPALNPVKPQALNPLSPVPNQPESPSENPIENLPEQTVNESGEILMSTQVAQEEPIALLEEVSQTEEKEEVPVATQTENTTSKQNVVAAPPLTPSPWYLDVLASPDFMSRQLNHPNAVYAQARRDAEKISSAFSIQLRAGYQLNKAISIQGGFLYSQINEELKYNKTFTRTEIVEEEKTGIILDPINGPTPYQYTVRDTVTHSTQVQGHSQNRYTFIDLPILLNYRFFVGNKWAWGVSGGPSFNLAFRQSGQILREDQMGFIELGKAENPYRTVAGVNLLFNVNAAYRLNSHFDLLFEPGVRLGMTSLTHSHTGMSQRYNGAQLFGGVRYRF